MSIDPKLLQKPELRHESELVDQLRQELAQEKETNARELGILRQTVIRVRGEAQDRFEQLTAIKADYYRESLEATREVIKAREELAACKAEHAQCLKDKDKLIADLVASTGRLEEQVRQTLLINETLLGLRGKT
jgi:hypothetical protein